MTRPLQVLLVEDDPDDADLLLRELKRGGWLPQFERVDTEAAMRAALERQKWDVIVADYHMPSFSGPEALALMKQQGLDLPFLIVSGTVDESTAVEAMRAGAHDFMAKGQLARLLPAIERELREASMRAERRKMQEQLLIFDRMASLGTLAAGMAHEINNPLAALMANLDFAARAWRDQRTAELAEVLADARDAADQVRAIVKDLKLFAYAGDEQRRGSVDLEHVLEWALRMAWNEIRHRANVTRGFAQVPPVDGHESRLGQVFLNLLVNAAQAIPEGQASQHQIGISARPTADGRRVVVEISDTGAGIPADRLDRVFDAFVTTKPAGVGTGLGLAMCKRIVTDMGGEISVSSEPGKGTRFHVILPRAGMPADADVPMPAQPAAAAPNRRGRVLVVDDEAMIGVAVARMLAVDHDVITVTTAREALAWLATGVRFDMILCDLMMPHMTGMDLHAAILAAVPEQAARMVFMTGGAFTSAAREFLRTVKNPRLDKPFDAADLAVLLLSLVRS